MQLTKTSKNLLRACMLNKFYYPSSSRQVINEWIRSDSSPLFFRCYYYFVPAVFLVQCISVGYQEKDVVA